ncbi:hypothetical protein P5G50_18515 [Leifsonia sp. F6_8S_P_1B]|uniref:Uncharacterized protein n=1 Tax=Leifsonia williamsii TaxID=3035919 RepID=A0ABT8KG63_9MICO|nr:hypothetical protein [Leifsonia williamsii]MDN4616446.1 hypothetical protein [Leifsonia williamsii]
MKAFLTVAFVASITLCVASALAGLMTLYYAGAVLAILTACTAMCGTILNSLEGDNK